MSYLFSNCKSMKNFPTLDTSKVTTFNHMFNNCTEMVTAPNYNLERGNDFGGCFYGCISLTTIPNYTMTRATALNDFVAGCTSLVTFPSINITREQDGQISCIRMCDGCSNLANFPVLDFSYVQTLQNAFRNCYVLTNDALYNIIESLKTLTSKYTDQKTLYRIGLNSTQQTTCQSLSNWPDLVALGWTVS